MSLWRQGDAGPPRLCRRFVRLAAGGNRIQIIGPAPAKGSSGRCQSETAARKAEPLTGSGPKRQCLPGVAAHGLSLRGGTASSNPTSSSEESVANFFEIQRSRAFSGVNVRQIGRSLNSDRAQTNQITGGEFTAKDFRTWAGTNLAALALRGFEHVTAIHAQSCVRSTQVSPTVFPVVPM